MAPGLDGADAVGQASPNLNGSLPPCEHADSLAPMAPQSQACPECAAKGVRWQELRVCLTCGWVACSDDSPLRHALAHYEETDHPVTAALEAEPHPRWCYVHRRPI
jgi:uncharacterized UBP type Zn finger protein